MRMMELLRRIDSPLIESMVPPAGLFSAKEKERDFNIVRAAGAKWIIWFDRDPWNSLWEAIPCGMATCDKIALIVLIVAWALWQMQLN